MFPFTFSIIIPSRGRDQCLRTTLEDLKNQTNKDFDVWVVDQNEVPLNGLEHSFPDKERFHHETMPPLGSHAGRNHAIFKTAAEYCLFVDDDVRISPDFVEQHLKAFKSCDRRVGALAGRVIQPKDGYTQEQMQEMGRLARYNKWFGHVTGNFVGGGSGEVEHIHECNFSARTTVLKAIGGFNEEFKGNAYFEGADLALRIIDAGFSVKYNPELVLTHLQEGAGGNRVSEKARHTYWFMRNYGLLNSLHMKKLGAPLYGIYGTAYVAGKALKNRDPNIAVQGFKGLFDGLKYFVPGQTRLKLRK